MHDIAILAVIWLSVFISSFMAHKTRLTPVLWFLFFGALFVNIGVLPEKMPEFITSFAELGIIIIMFALGFEENINNFLSSIRRCWGIALFGALGPFIIAFSVIWLFWSDLNMALICALAMTSTAVSLTMVSLKTEGLSRTPAATGIMAAAVLDSFTSLLLVAILVPVVAGGASVSLDGILLILGKAVVFFVIVTLLGAWLFPANQGALNKIPLVGQLNLRRILSMGHGEYTILSLLLIAVLVSLLAHEFGLHPAVGAYMAGLIIHKECFNFQQGGDADHYQRAKTIIDNVAFSWIGPVFFVTLGSRLVFELDIFISVIPICLTLFTGLFIGQILSAALAARYTGKFDWPASWMIGFGMLGRAELAFVVMDIAFVQLHIISVEAFYTLMMTTFLLNCSVPLTIRWWKARFYAAQGQQLP